MESVTVIYNTTNSNYEVNMRPHHCGYNFDDLALDEAQVNIRRFYYNHININSINCVLFKI